MARNQAFRMAWARSERRYPSATPNNPNRAALNPFSLSRLPPNPFRPSVNESAMVEFEDYHKMVHVRDMETDIALQDLARHVIPPDWRTNKQWDRNMRACCMCGMLKTEVGGGTWSFVV